MEYWSDGQKPNTPLLLYSNTPFYSSASEIFLSSLQTESFSNPLEDS
jgi:hypothetical protein